MNLGEIFQKNKKKTAKEKRQGINIGKNNPLIDLSEIVGISMKYSIEEKKNIERRRKLNE